MPSMVVALGLVMPATAMVAGATDDTGGESNESLDADPALLAKALGSESTEGVPEPVLAAIARAGEPVDDAMLEVALECWSNKSCETGTGGEITVALADGFGENVWREVTYMEFILQALTYPEIGEIIYTERAK